MIVQVDTSVWSLALRRRAPAHAAVGELRALINEGRLPTSAWTTPLRGLWQHPPYFDAAARQI